MTYQQLVALRALIQAEAYAAVSGGSRVSRDEATQVYEKFVSMMLPKQKIVMVQCYRHESTGDIVFFTPPQAPNEFWQPIGDPQSFEVPE